MDLAFILQIIQDVRHRFQREEEQAILQRSMDKAMQALAGKDACTRIVNELMSRKAMFDSIRAASEKKRKRAVTPLHRGKELAGA